MTPLPGEFSIPQSFKYVSTTSFNISQRSSLKNLPDKIPATLHKLWEEIPLHFFVARENNVEAVELSGWHADIL